MRNLSIKGLFRLKPGIRLIPGQGDGVVLRDSPLRAFRVNAAAFRLLQRCKEGLSIEELSRTTTNRALESTLSVFDRFCQAGLLHWEPPPGSYEPFVSIIVAVYNRAQEIGECLESLLSLDYPRTKREIIVVDDGSTDATPQVVRGYDVTLLEMDRNRGQSAARNAGVAAARGEIVAFVDSDCIAEPAWLAELVPYFQDDRNVLVGGFVDSYYTESLLDRYEEAKSPLCMGWELVVGQGVESDFYVPTCNMLVRKGAYLRVGGLNEDQRVGEDVDLCWKLKEIGARLLYVPKGKVKHKHRNRFLDTFRRRFDYGTSEALLHAAHRQAAKRYPWNCASMAILLGCLVGLFAGELLVLPLIPTILLWDTLAKKRRYERKVKTSLPFKDVFAATLQTHFQLLYHLNYHVVRYYVLVMVILAALFKPLIPVVAACIVFASFSEFRMKKPRLSYLEFLFFFIMEHASYQVGAFWGSIQQKSFRNYRLLFVTPGKTRQGWIHRKVRARFRKAEHFP